MGRQIILYSTGCTRCKLVKQMLDVHHVEYTEITDRQIIEEKDFDSVPVLEADGKCMEYSELLTWLEQNNYYSLWEDKDGSSET